jgi:hypothetical protein
MTATVSAPKRLDVSALEHKVKAMYRDVALNPHGEFHFEMGRALAERLGYALADLDAIPREAIDSFAGVGHYFDLAELEPGQTVVDLGSGSATPPPTWTRSRGRRSTRSPASATTSISRSSSPARPSSTWAAARGPTRSSPR